MALFKDDPPQPPDPRVTAGAQTATNVSTAVANAFLNNVNQKTPLGNLNYTQGTPFDWQDPVSGAVYSIPRFTAEQNLGPTQQATLDKSEQAKLNLATLAEGQSGRLNTLLGSNIDVSQVPGAPQLAPQVIDLRDLSMFGPVQTALGDAGPITRDYDPSGALTQRDRVEAALNARLDPQLAKERTRYEQQLSDAGIQAGSPAYSSAMKDYGDQVSNARLDVIAKGGQEQKLQADLAAQRAGFQNAAQQQMFNQIREGGQFANAAQQQQFGQAQGTAEFFNRAARQHYFEDPSTRRQQALTELYALRNQPINEVTALLSGAQVQQPHFMETPRNQIPTTDFAGIQAQANQQAQQAWQTQMAQTNALIGGIFGAAGNIGRGLITSDERVKENVHRIGSVFVAEPQPVAEPNRKKLPVYEYSYKGDPSGARHVGPMAQDVEKVDPRAVRSIGGIKHIDVGRMGDILRAA